MAPVLGQNESYMVAQSQSPESLFGDGSIMLFGADE